MVGKSGSAAVHAAIGEAVPGAAVEVHLPVDAGVVHLLLEGGALGEGDDRIEDTDAHQHLAGDVGRRGRVRVGQPTVEADDGVHGCATATEFERHGAAEAVTDGSDPRSIGQGVGE